MTIPDRSNLPYYSEQISSGGKDLAEYVRELVSALNTQYNGIYQTISGSVSDDLGVGGWQYIPTVIGSTTEGVGTYVADHQTSYVMWQGIFVDAYIDIGWTAHTGTGDLIIEMPYQCVTYDNYPFIGTVMSENLIFSGYLCGVMEPGTRNLSIVDVQSGGAFAPVAVSNFATTLRIHIRYPGVEVEID